MSQFQMTHVALVGARMETFRPLGFNSRSELAGCRVFPDTGGGTFNREPLDAAAFGRLLPLWVHNAIKDPDFPQRDRLQMALRRFEGELRDNRNNEVVAAALTAGFRDRQFDPLNLPRSMPLRQRCTILLHIDVWREAYTALEKAFTSLLCTHVGDIENWMATSPREIDAAVTV